jgi:TonB-linked SusC/RagA family outer membrane protein
MLRPLFFAAILFTVFNHSMAQGDNSGKRTSLQDALKQINHVFGTNFVYDQELLKGKTTTYDMQTLRNKTLEEVLKGILYPDGLVFLYVKRNYYTIVPKERIREQWNPGMAAPDSAVNMTYMAQPMYGARTRLIGGQVKDKNGNPLRNVTVAVRGQGNSVSANEGGWFKLEVPDRKDVFLAFSSIGYEPQEVPVKNTSMVYVVMIQSSVSLQEVVVVGYGVEKKEDLTGAISTVKTEELNENHSSTAVSDMLAGRLPGLFVQKSDGTVGTGSDLKIRGLSTFNNSNPLIVIDGIPDRSIDDLNPTDIDAISVLKDASAIAVYGARAANGVILVTTRKGKSGKPEMSFSSTLISQSPTFMYKKLNSYNYATLQNEAFNNEGSYNPAFGEGYTPAQVDLYQSGTDPNHYPNTNWIKTLSASHLLQSSYNLSASGGSENIKYFLSGGYVTNGGFVPVEYYRRWNLRSDIEANITRNLKVNLNLGGVFSTTNGEGVYGLDYVFEQALTTPPTRVNQFTNGDYAYVPEQRGNAYIQSRGLTGFNTTWNNTLNSTMNVQWDIPWIRGLSMVGTGAYDKGYVFAKQFAKPYNQYEVDSFNNYTLIPSYPVAPYLNENFTQSASLTLEGSLRYTTAFGANHISALALYTQTKATTDLFGAERQNFVSASLPQLSLGDPSQSTNSGSGTLSTRQGVVGRLTYDYDSRYLLEFSFRDDGSDIFPPGHRFGFFPAISGGWVISKERFFKAGNLDFLKLRGSWGELGNDQVAPYQFLTSYSLAGGSQYATGGYTFGGANPTFYQGLQPGVLANPNFTWERAIMSNIGLEAHFKQDLITIEADYFHKRTKDILTPPSLQVPGVLGATLPDYNNGIVENSGFEIAVGHHNHIGKVSYYVTGNVSYNHNKIVSYPESQSTPAWQKITGTSVGGFYNSPYPQYVPSGPTLGFKSAGLYQTTQEVTSGPTPIVSTAGPGDIKYVDVDKDGAITANDEVVIGKKFFPAIQYGIRFGASFAGIECNVLLQGTADVRGYNYPANYNLVPAAKWLLDRWTPTHTNASFPRLWANYYENEEGSDYWVVNTSYLRLKNLELAYNFPHKLLNSRFRNIRISLSGNNLLTISKFRWYDPEAMNVTNPLAGLSNPLLKSFTAGATLQF